MSPYNNTAAQHDTIANTLSIYKDSSNSESIRSIARKFDLSETTLRRAIKNDGPLARPGHSKALTDHEEEQLVGYCLNMQKLDFGFTKSGVNQCVTEIIRHK